MIIYSYNTLSVGWTVTILVTVNTANRLSKHTLQISSPSPVAVGTSQMDASHMACPDTADRSHRVWNRTDVGGGNLYHSLSEKTYQQSYTKKYNFAMALTSYTRVLYCKHTHTHRCWPLLWRVSTGRVHAALTVRRSHVVLTPGGTHAPLHPHDMVRSEDQTTGDSLHVSDNSSLTYNFYCKHVYLIAHTLLVSILCAAHNR